LKNYFRKFSIILNVLRIWRVRVTAWAVEIFDEDNKEWYIELYGVTIWEQYGLALQLVYLGSKIEDDLSQNGD
jgi:hypothetical protein